MHTILQGEMAMTIDTERFRELMAQYRWADMIGSDPTLVEKSYRAVVEYVDEFLLFASANRLQG